MRRRFGFLFVLVGAGLFAVAMPGASLATIGATLVVAIALPIVAATSLHPLAGTPRGRAASPPWNWAALFGALGLSAAALVLLANGPEPWWAPPVAALALGGAVLWLFDSLWLAPMRAVARIRTLADDPARLEPAARALVASFAGPPPAGAVARRRRALRAMAASGALLDVLRFADANEILGRVDPASLPAGELRGALLSTRAAVALYRADRNAAFADLKEAAQHAKTPLLSDIILQNQALLEAQEGRGADALEKLARLGPPPDALRRRGQLVVRAHALAATGEVDAARAVVAEIFALGDEAGGLARTAHMPGPAQLLFREALEARAR